MTMIFCCIHYDNCSWSNCLQLQTLRLRIALIPQSSCVLPLSKMTVVCHKVDHMTGPSLAVALEGIHLEEITFSSF